MDEPATPRAVVLGGSLAGLLAARVLADRFEHVTVVERDDLGTDVAHRRGVPHGRHVHGLLPRGGRILEDLFPGLTAQAVEEGAVLAEDVGQVRYLLSGHRFAHGSVGRTGLFASRPFLEAQVRDRVRALEQVTLLDGHDVVGPEATADRTRVVGVRVADRSGGQATLAADLVVDATGRGSRAPRWLEELGYRPPAEDRVEIGIEYVSRRFRLRPGATDGDALIVVGAIPANPRAGALGALEGDTHLVTLVGQCGDRPPSDSAGFSAYAAALPFPDIAEALVDAVPLEDLTTFRFPASVRRRYEDLRDFPQGLLVIGDAVCSFNPVYGQGMTVAASEALALRDSIAADLVPDHRRYFRRVAAAVQAPWDIAVGGDLVFPEVPGKRTLRVRGINAYMARLHAAAAHDLELADAFARVAGLLDPPQALLRPDRALRVWRTNRRHRADVSPTARPTVPT